MTRRPPPPSRARRCASIRCNPQLIERAFVSALANGNMLDSFTLADRLLAKQPTDGLAHLVLGVKALKSHQWRAGAHAARQGRPGAEPRRPRCAAHGVVVGRQRRREEGDRILRPPDRRTISSRSAISTPGLIADMMG